MRRRIERNEELADLVDRLVLEEAQGVNNRASRMFGIDNGTLAKMLDGQVPRARRPRTARCPKVPTTRQMLTCGCGTCQGALLLRFALRSPMASSRKSQAAHPSWPQAIILYRMSKSTDNPSNVEEVSIQEAAHRLGVSVKTIERRIKARAIEARKVGGRWLGGFVSSGPALGGTMGAGRQTSRLARQPVILQP